MYPPASQKEWKLEEVPLDNLIVNLLPPTSPLGYVSLYKATECKGWCISPTTWVKYLAKRARSAVVLLILVDNTLIAWLTVEIELTAT